MTEKKPVADKQEKLPEENGSRTLGEMFTALDSIVSAMETEDSLEKTFAMYQEGIALLKSANDSLDRIEKQVRVLDEEGILGELK